MSNLKEIKSKFDVPLTKPLLEEDEIEKSIEKGEIILLENHKEILDNTNFYWVIKKTDKILHVDYQSEIPKRYISKSIVGKNEYIDCTFFIGYLMESVKDLNEKVDILEEHVLKLTKHVREKRK